MKVQILSLAALASLVSGFSLEDSPLNVELEITGNTAVKALIKNTGSEDLKLFKTGTFLDDSDVEKVEVFQAEQKVPFDGIRLRVSTSNLDESAFQIIAAGETIEASFDIATAHDLSSGGDFKLVTEGAFAYANLDSTEIAGAVPFITNSVDTAIDGEKAGKIRRDYIELSKRTVVQTDCTGTRRTATLTALSNCASLARTAAAAANSNTAKMTEYFKSTTSATRSTVAAVFNRVASQCGSSTSGDSRYYCSDVRGACSSGVLAYTSPSTSQMVNCPLFFSGLTALSRTCHAQDQATTVLHEMTHLTQVKGTSDYNGYGYSFVRSLSAAQNLNHADTYTLFAQALYAGC
ncbi:hypothetical protein N0V94_006769 [Neodidymelliopsis sp. IMI 364377]|nr:hypothetical protein N0V94_006769 [Neodidymelliopsis sp. IMI 364377]